jgi:hypothetical protein
MSDTHVDRNACAAAGCPGLASMSRGTNGESPWYCPAHFAADYDDRLLVTNELNRLKWIVDIVRTLRAGGTVTADQNQSFVLAHRSDLKQKESEWPLDWMIRLEGVLQQSCKDSVVQP